MADSSVFSFVPIGQIRAPPLGKVLDTSIAGLATRSERRKPPDLLERFCLIAESADTDAAIVAFARRWGLLGLCEHGLPSEGLCNGHSTCTPCGWTGTESFDHWRRLARAFQSMLRIGLALNRGKPGENADWELAADGLCGDAGEELLGHWWAEGIAPRLNDVEITRRTTKGLRVARIDYAILMQRLIEISHLQPEFGISGRNWNIEMGSTPSNPSQCSNFSHLQPEFGISGRNWNMEMGSTPSSPSQCSNFSHLQPEFGISGRNWNIEMGSTESMSNM